MKTQVLLVTLLLVSTAFVMEAQKSPRKQVEETVAGVEIKIDYSAPSVKGRTVWGGLEAYDKVWRAGADQNTTIAFDKDVTLAGQKIAAGKYGFFIIPKEEGDWIVIFNKRNADWGAYSYDQKQDALRLNIAPEMQNEIREQLSYNVGDSEIVFGWEKVQLSIPIEAK